MAEVFQNSNSKKNIFTFCKENKNNFDFRCFKTKCIEWEKILDDPYTKQTGVRKQGFNPFRSIKMINYYTGCPKKVETRFNFLVIEDKHRK